MLSYIFKTSGNLTLWIFNVDIFESQECRRFFAFESLARSSRDPAKSELSRYGSEPLNAAIQALPSVERKEAQWGRIWVGQALLYLPNVLLTHDSWLFEAKMPRIWDLRFQWYFVIHHKHIIQMPLEKNRIEWYLGIFGMLKIRTTSNDLMPEFRQLHCRKMWNNLNDPPENLRSDERCIEKDKHLSTKPIGPTVVLQMAATRHRRMLINGVTQRFTTELASEFNLPSVSV